MNKVLLKKKDEKYFFFLNLFLSFSKCFFFNRNSLHLDQWPDGFDRLTDVIPLLK